MAIKIEYRDRTKNENIKFMALLFVNDRVLLTHSGKTKAEAAENLRVSFYTLISDMETVIIEEEHRLKAET